MTPVSRPTRDNHPALRRRPPVVATDDLERALRDCLVDQTVRAPSLVDPAERAIRRARRVRRNRIGAATLAGVCLAGSTSALAAGLAPAATPAPALLAEAPVLMVTPSGATTTGPAAQAAPLPLSDDLRRQPLAAAQVPPVDVVLADGLHTSDGRRIDLGPIAAVSQASRIPDGWLLVEEQPSGETGVWFVTATAAPRVVLPGVDGVVFDPAGTRIAWRTGAEVAVARLVDGELADLEHTAVSPETRPVGFAGDAVLMARADGEDNPAGYDVWWPGRGQFQPTWNETATAVYGSLPDGQSIVAQINDVAGRSCLALLDVRRELAASKTVCALPLTSDGRGAVSHDGRWLMANGTADTRSTTETELAMLVDLGEVFDQEPAAIREAGPRLTGTAVWADAETVVHVADDEQLVRINVDRISTGQDGAVERYELPTDMFDLSDAHPVLVDGALTDFR
ncbi:hypothetical protein O7632_29070 [Solwaraspora sp. WMMD406]|uniref:hypothetical protein n=1 Tax=Solwaraspora sp. WMMD406 TaxID=3016095 RepID=UPI0024177719|nr:hypothetical protein [Solwaraspora sp. WMMD406]MDG4768112.1 hypothetical protein [Solwaraspora sp. WMMD406]